MRQCIAVVKERLTEHHSAAVKSAAEKEAANLGTFTHQRLVIRRERLYTRHTCLDTNYCSSSSSSSSSSNGSGINQSL